MRMIPSLKKTALAFLFSVTAVSAFAQFEIANSEYIDDLKNGTTYITMKDTGSVKSAEYKALFRKYWTFSKFKFINYTDISDYIAKGNSFLSIGGYETTTQFTTLYSDGRSKNGIDYSNTHIYMEFWTVSNKFFEKNKKEVSDKDRVRVGRIELFTDFFTLNEPKNIYKTDYDGDGHIRNWGPGFVKNYVLLLNNLLAAKTERKLYDTSSDPKKLKELKTQTLYVPDYVLIKFNKFTGDETKRNEEKEIFGDYKYKYKMMSGEELNNAILSSDEHPFYYLIYIKSSTDKYITVMNSKTGEFIYTDYVPVSYNITSKDLKSLSDAIGK